MARQWVARTGGLLGLLVLAGVGWADEDSAVKTIEALCGDVRRDSDRPGKPVIGVNLASRHVTDADLRVLKEFKSLRSLVLNAASVTNAGLAELKGLTTLEVLYLGSTKITDAGLKELKGLKSLKRLSLIDTTISDTGIQDLTRL